MHDVRFQLQQQLAHGEDLPERRRVLPVYWHENVFRALPTKLLRHGPAFRNHIGLVPTFHQVGGELHGASFHPATV